MDAADKPIGSLIAENILRASEQCHAQSSTETKTKTALLRRELKPLLLCDGGLNSAAAMDRFFNLLGGASSEQHRKLMLEALRLTSSSVCLARLCQLGLSAILQRWLSDGLNSKRCSILMATVDVVSHVSAMMGFPAFFRNDDDAIGQMRQTLMRVASAHADEQALATECILALSTWPDKKPKTATVLTNGGNGQKDVKDVQSPCERSVAAEITQEATSAHRGSHRLSSRLSPTAMHQSDGAHDNSEKLGTKRARPASASCASEARPKAAKQSSHSRRSKREEVYYIERILEMRLVAPGTEEFKVRWYGFSECDDTWEPASNIINPELIREFKCRQASGSSPCSEARPRRSIAAPSTPPSKPSPKKAASSQRKVGATVGSAPMNGPASKDGSPPSSRSMQNVAKQEQANAAAPMATDAAEGKRTSLKLERKKSLPEDSSAPSNRTFPSLQPRQRGAAPSSTPALTGLPLQQQCESTRVARCAGSEADAVTNVDKLSRKGEAQQISSKSEHLKPRSVAASELECAGSKTRASLTDCHPTNLTKLNSFDGTRRSIRDLLDDSRDGSNRKPSDISGLLNPSEKESGEGTISVLLNPIGLSRHDGSDAMPAYASHGNAGAPDHEQFYRSPGYDFCSQQTSLHTAPEPVKNSASVLDWRTGSAPYTGRFDVRPDPSAALRREFLDPGGVFSTGRSFTDSADYMKPPSWMATSYFASDWHGSSMAPTTLLRQPESDRTLYGHSHVHTEGYPPRYRQSHQRYGGDYRQSFAASHETNQLPYLRHDAPQHQVRNLGPYEPAQSRRVLQSFF